MADEIKITLKCTLDKGNLYQEWNKGQQTLSLTNVPSNAGGVVEVGTSVETMSQGDVAAASTGYLFMRNLDATNYVQWGPDSGGSMIAALKLLPGEQAMMPINPSTTYKWQANTAECQVEYLLIERA